jgi:serine/threonine protein kinase
MSRDAWLSTELAGYRIEALVGRGGMGVVYRAHDIALDRPVALKLISPGLAEDERFRQRFLHESRVAASIVHANIVPIYDAGESRGQLYIAMRFVAGTDLGRVLETEGALEPERTLRLLGQAASGLDAAHERGLVHRDAKPANILLTEEAGRGEHAYLSDFGLAREGGARQPGDSDEVIVARASGSLGTIDYASPEQIEGKPADARTDVYCSAACCLSR